MEKRVEFELTQDEITRATTIVPLVQVRKILKTTLLVGLLTIFCFILYIFGEETKNIMKISCIVYMVLFVFLILLTILNIPSVKMKLFFKRNKKNNIFITDTLKFEYEFYDDFLIQKSSSNFQTTEVKHEYKNFVRIEKNNEFIYFFINNISFIMCKAENLTKDELNEIVSKIKNDGRKKYYKNYKK